MLYLLISKIFRKKSDRFFRSGFTLIELSVVIFIIGLLTSISFLSLREVRDRAYLAAAKSELYSVRQAVEFYVADYGDYPSDTERSVPPGLEQYLGGHWPATTWPNSVFDWDNWIDPETGEKIYQISIRFCPINQPSQCRFPHEDWAVNFELNSSVYYCISGLCRAHISEPVDYPGYCINCPQN